MQVTGDYGAIERMKNTISLIVLFFSTIAWSQVVKPEWSFEMKSAFYLEYSNRPSSKEGQFEFNFSDLDLVPTVHVTEELSATFWGNLVGQRLAGSKKYAAELENVFIIYRQKSKSQWIHELGLIRPVWHRHEGIIAKTSFFGITSKSLAERYNFLQMGDLGYQGRYNVSDEAFVAFGTINGEENASDEAGASKEAFLSYIHQNPQQLIGLWLSYGQVDVADEEVSERSRALLRYQRHLGRFMLGLEAMWAQDPSSDYEVNERGEAMTFIELADPENLTTEAGRIDLSYRLNDQQIVLIRYDLLCPELDSKDIESWTTAWVKSENVHHSWGVFYENTLYGTQHSAQSRQRERVLLGMSLHF